MFVRLILVAYAFLNFSAAAAQNGISLQASLDLELSEAATLAPGAAAVVLYGDGEMVRANRGFADDSTGAPVTPETRFFSGSIGKTITAVVAASLINDGVIALDDPISKYLGDRKWFPKLKNRDSITVRMLLNHSAGVPSYLEDTRFFLSQNGRRLKGYTPDELIAYVAKDKPKGAPGDHFSYSDTHYIMIGLIIEKATGRKFYDLAQEIVLTPLSLEDTTPLIGRKHANLANAYRSKGLGNRLINASGPAIKNGQLTFMPEHEWTGGGFVTTPADLAKFYLGLFSDPRFAAQHALMTDNKNLNRLNDKIAYGLGVYVNNRNPESAVYAHGGDFMGYRSFVLYEVKLGAAIAVQANAKQYEPGDVAFAILNVLRRQEN